MRRPATLPAFTPEQLVVAHRLLATRVALMMGRKLEEGDWSQVYCAAKGIPDRGWSNLNLDIVHRGLGVEHKMLRLRADVSLRDACGTTLMHPSATRSIRVPEAERDANIAMRDVLSQYAAYLEERRRKVAEGAEGREPDMRTGWLLWQPNLRDFLYFEEEVIAPDPQDYFAEWKESGGGTRKTSKNLWVYEVETGKKRYSITTAAGPKIQPYFDVPPPSDPNIYFFRVQGEEFESGLVRVWIAASTERELRGLVGDLTAENMGLVIEAAVNEPAKAEAGANISGEEARPLVLTAESYELLVASFPGVSDEHMLQLLLRRLRQI